MDLSLNMLPKVTGVNILTFGLYKHISIVLSSILYYLPFDELVSCISNTCRR